MAAVVGPVALGDSGDGSGYSSSQLQWWWWGHWPSAAGGSRGCSVPLLLPSPMAIVVDADNTYRCGRPMLLVHPLGVVALCCLQVLWLHYGFSCL